MPRSYSTRTFDVATYARFRARAVAIASSGRCAGWADVLREIQKERFTHATEWIAPANFRAELDRLCSQFAAPISRSGIRSGSSGALR